MQLLQIRDGVGGRADIRLGDDFDQRRAGTVEVDARLADMAFVHRLAGVFFHVRARDADALGLSVNFNVEMAFVNDRQFVLRDLVALRQIRIEIRSEEHTSELQSLMRISYAVFCLTKKKKKNN